MRKAACHANHLIVCTLRDIAKTELIVDVIKQIRTYALAFKMKEQAAH